MKNRLLIAGAGELGQQILHYSKVQGKYEVIGFADDFQKRGETIKDIPVLGNLSDIESLYQKDIFDFLIIGIGYNHLGFKDELYNKFKGKIPFATIIANPSYIDKTSILGEGTIIYPGVIIDKNVEIKPNVVINLGSILSHDCMIGRSTFIAPGTVICGFSSIGTRCMIGANSTVLDNKKIADDIIVGAASSVTKDLIARGIYFGSPCYKRYEKFTIS